VTCTEFLEFVDKVFEVLDVSALVGADRDSIHIFLNGSANDFLHRAIVCKVDYFGTAGLKYAAHNIDGSIMAIEQAGCSQKPDWLVTGLRRAVSRLCCALAGKMNYTQGLLPPEILVETDAVASAGLV
jgi:hypothetical protein